MKVYKLFVKKINTIFVLFSEVNKLRPELSILGSDMSNIRNGVARLSRAITSGDYNVLG